MKVLQTTETIKGEKRGFRMREGQVFTYTQSKTGLSFFYGKRKVLEDSVSTDPTDM